MVPEQPRKLITAATPEPLSLLRAPGFRIIMFLTIRFLARAARDFDRVGTRPPVFEALRVRP